MKVICLYSSSGSGVDALDS